MAQPTFSKHPKLLEEAGYVDFNKDGAWANYYLTNGSASPYAVAILGNFKHCLENDPSIKDLVKKLPMIRREVICKR